jgi:hypothetical protein
MSQTGTDRRVESWCRQDKQRAQSSPYTISAGTMKIRYAK